MDFFIVLDNRKSCPAMAVFSACVMGALSPLTAWAGWYFGLAALQSGDGFAHGLIGITLFGVLWPLGGITALTIFALNPLFGKTCIRMDSESLDIRKTLLGCCWKHLRLPNDGKTSITLGCQTQQHPPRFSSRLNQQEQAIPTATYYRILLRRGNTRCCLHESEDEQAERRVLKQLTQARIAR